MKKLPLVVQKALERKLLQQKYHPLNLASKRLFKAIYQVFGTDNCLLIDNEPNVVSVEENFDFLQIPCGNSNWSQGLWASIWVRSQLLANIVKRESKPAIEEYESLLKFNYGTMLIKSRVPSQE